MRLLKYIRDRLLFRPRRAPWGEVTSQWVQADWRWFYNERLDEPFVRILREREVTDV